MRKSNNIFARFFGVVIRGQTYLNLVYLAIALPLAVFYFVFLVGGLTLGISLLIVLIGVLILLVVFAAWVAFVAFERQMAIWMLKVDVPPYLPEGTIQTGTSGFVGHIIANRATWTGLLFLFLKLPLGIFSLTLLLSLSGITLGSLAAPFIYNLVPIDIWLPGGVIWSISTLGDAMILFAFGVAMVFVSLHLLNIMAWVWGRIAYWMLGVERKPELEIEPVAVQEVETKGQEGMAVAATAAVVSSEQESVSDELTVEDEPPTPVEPVAESVSDEVALITPPPDGETIVIDESDLPGSEPEEDLSPPEWLLERYDALEYYDAESPPEPAEELSEAEISEAEVEPAAEESESEVENDEDQEPPEQA